MSNQNMNGEFEGMSWDTSHSEGKRSGIGLASTSIEDFKLVRDMTLIVLEDSIQAQPSPIELTQQKTKEESVQIINNNGIAVKIEAGSWQDINFFNHYIRPGQRIILRIRNTKNKWARSITIGLSSQSNLRQSDLQNNVELYLVQPGCWVSTEMSKDIGFELDMLVTLDGKVQVSRNRSRWDTVMHLDESKPLWVFAETNGSMMNVWTRSWLGIQNTKQQLNACTGSEAAELNRSQEEDHLGVLDACYYKLTQTTQQLCVTNLPTTNHQTHSRLMSDAQLFPMWYGTDEQTLKVDEDLTWLHAPTVLSSISRRNPQPTWSIPAQATQSSFSGSNRTKVSPLSFHSVHSKNVMLSCDSTVARCYPSYYERIVFSSRPIRVNEKVCFRFLDIENTPAVIYPGFTSHDPQTIENVLTQYTNNDLTSKPGNWAEKLWENFSKGDIFYYFVDSSGDIYYGINGERKGILCSGVDTSNKLWAVINLSTNCIAIQLTDIKGQTYSQPMEISVDSDTTREQTIWTMVIGIFVALFLLLTGKKQRNNS